MLCMGAPNPMGIAECAPTVRKVLRDLSRGKSLPTCTLQNGSDSRSSGNYVNHTRASITPQCPAGTTQGRDGVVYHQGRMPNGLNHWSAVSGGASNSLVDSDSRILFGGSDRYSSRVCVGGQHYGTFTTAQTRRDDPPPVTHSWYEKIQIMNPDGATWQFDFYTNNQLYSSHRF